MCIIAQNLESLPEEIGDLENLDQLCARDTLISRPPLSIARLNKLKFLSFTREESETGLEDGVCFLFPPVASGLRSLESLNLIYCNLIDGGLPEDIGCLYSLQKLDLSGNNFEHLPQSMVQLGDLQFLDFRDCKKLKELPDDTGMPNLMTLDLSNCMNLEEAHHSLGSFKKLCRLILTNCVQLKRFPGLCIDFLRDLCLQYCSSLEKIPKILRSTKVEPEIHMLDSVMRDLNSMYISFPRFLSQDIVSDIFAKDSLSQRLFRIVHGGNKIPSWFHHQGMDKSVSVNLPENWYVCDSFLGFVVCYSGNLIDITIHLIPSPDNGMSWMTHKIKFSYLHKCSTKSTISFFMVPLVRLWDTSKTNGKTPNDYGRIRLSFSGEMEVYGFRLLYKDEPKLKALLQMRENNDEPTEHRVGTSTSEYHDSAMNEASCSSSKKQRLHF